MTEKAIPLNENSTSRLNGLANGGIDPMPDTSADVSIFFLLLSVSAAVLKKIVVWCVEGVVLICALLTLYYHNTIIGEMGLSTSWQKVKTSIVRCIGHPLVTASSQIVDTANTRSVPNRSSRSPIEKSIRKWSSYYNVHPDLAFAVAQAESGLKSYPTRFEPDYYKCYVLGTGKNCRKLSIPECWRNELRETRDNQMMATSWGLFQIMPMTAAETASKEGFLSELKTIPALLDVDLNARIGVSYLRWCIDTQHGDFTRIAMCYNGQRSNGWSEAVKKALFERIIDQSLKGNQK